VAYYQVSLVSYMSSCSSLFMNNSRSGHVSVSIQASEKQESDMIVVLPEDDPETPLSQFWVLVCSGVAKMTASITTYPHEVIRTRLQTQRLPLADDASSDGMVKSHSRRGVIYTTRKMITKEGWTALYKGLSINLIRTVPNSIVTMSV
jgi:solute carrier family 25 (mitochondrial folate transporter), member 32